MRNIPIEFNRLKISCHAYRKLIEIHRVIDSYLGKAVGAIRVSVCIGKTCIKYREESGLIE